MCSVRVRQFSQNLPESPPPLRQDLTSNCSLMIEPFSAARFHHEPGTRSRAIASSAIADYIDHQGTISGRCRYRLHQKSGRWHHGSQCSHQSLWFYIYPNNYHQKRYKY